LSALNIIILEAHSECAIRIAAINGSSLNDLGFGDDLCGGVYPMNKYDEAMKLLDEKLGNKDGLISLSTIALEPGADGKSRPAARIIDAYYEDGAFYTVTYATSARCGRLRKTRSCRLHPRGKLHGHGIGENLAGCVMRRTRG
jgi:hypothetical protein